MTSNWTRSGFSSQCTEFPYYLPLVGVKVSVFLHVTMAVSGMMVNGLVLVTGSCIDISQFRPSHLFIMNLAAVDCLGAGICSTFHIWRLLTTTAYDQLALCAILHLPVSFFSCLCAWSVAVISVDRYKLIVNHAIYRRTVTFLRGKMAIAFVWILSAAIGIVPLVVAFSLPVLRCVSGHALFTAELPDEVRILFVCLYSAIGYLLPTVIVCHRYAAVAKVAWTRQVRGAGRHAASRPTSPLRDLRTARILSLLAACYGVCFSPYFIAQFLWGLQLWQPPCPPLIVEIVTRALLVGNSLLNPFFYAFTDQHFRRFWRIYLIRNAPALLSCCICRHIYSPDLPKLGIAEENVRDEEQDRARVNEGFTLGAELGVGTRPPPPRATVAQSQHLRCRVWTVSQPAVGVSRGRDA